MKSVIILMLFFTIDLYSQSHEEYRLKDQYYYEDSTNVFWIGVPNPFAPPTVIGNYSKGRYCGNYTFHCDLSDTVMVAFQNETDSTLYSAKIISKNPPFFSLCLWIAGSLIESNKLPKNYYQTNGNEKIKIVLIVKGKRKCYLEALIGDKDPLAEISEYKKYYWFAED